MGDRILSYRKRAIMYGLDFVVCDYFEDGSARRSFDFW